ncbi:helix-turn-helix domain-containing protein [Faecalicoccus pleomorphus]|nr:helix-turn-helix domain-containing protein [Faecalicoccus pleomorphus]
MCEMLGHISLKTGYRLLQKKTIPSFRIGRLRFILKEDILAFMRQQC